MKVSWKLDKGVTQYSVDTKLFRAEPKRGTIRQRRTSVVERLAEHTTDCKLAKPPLRISLYNSIYISQVSRL